MVAVLAPPIPGHQRDKAVENFLRRDWETTYLSIIPHHIRICQHLREHGTERRRTIHRGTIPGNLEQLAEEEDIRRSLFGRGEREELADLEGGVAERARVLREDRVLRQPFGLRYCGL
jgi:hypothetical protein